MPIFLSLPIKTRTPWHAKSRRCFGDSFTLLEPRLLVRRSRRYRVRAHHTPLYEARNQVGQPDPFLLRFAAVRASRPPEVSPARTPNRSATSHQSRGALQTSAL